VSQAATATDLDVVHTAYEAYEGAAKALERSIDVVHSKLNTAGLTPEEMQKLQLQLDALKARCCCKQEFQITNYLLVCSATLVPDPPFSSKTRVCNSTGV